MLFGKRKRIVKRILVIEDEPLTAFDNEVMIKDAGYDGTPIVLMHSTDLKVLTNLAPVAKSLLEKGGFKVDMQSMDWQSVVARRAKKDPPSQGGWNAMITSWVSQNTPAKTGE